MKLRNTTSAAAALAIAATSVGAQTAASANQSATVDAKWNAWYGCWRPEAVDGVAPPNHAICILPVSSNSVSIATVADGKIVAEQPIIADGSRRATDEGGCKGFESATFSQDQRRVFLTSDLNCGSGVQRKSTGVLALVSAGSYVDVQTVEVNGQSASRTVRYVALRDNETPAVAVSRLMDQPLARESARIGASAPLDFEDVVEASRIVGAETTNGLLVARRTGFQLNASRLRTLVAEGVQPATIDVMVGLTYPEHFQVAEEAPRAMNNARANDADRWGYDPRYIRTSCDDRYGFGRYNGLSYDPYAMGYARCGYNSYYSPYGYDAYGWGYGTGNVIVLSPSGSGTDVENGAIVKGKGYTRRNASTGTARPRDPVPSTTTTTTTRSTGTSTTGTARSGGSTGTSTAGSSGGSSSGSSTGRTAKPKGGGGQ